MPSAGRPHTLRKAGPTPCEDCCGAWFRTLEAFYKDNPDRRRRGEADYGVRWIQAPWRGRRRVSCVQAAGEVYAVLEGDGPVVVLGSVPPDPVPSATTAGARRRPIAGRRTVSWMAGWSDADSRTAGPG